ncbi:hypothetical protein RHA1_ro09011 (plasmid) [Rhodococcus jostii RHA1]|uniref:Uncharacterized protein n=1 Tax=Rhodococcus jostii (strain RHA1) TaxID=101510 RepID=Q0RXD1_RHOJR|nr:hypothetical protein RHA1_ro09011 [Rhodococcus jostii RHA1]
MPGDKQWSGVFRRDADPSDDLSLDGIDRTTWPRTPFPLAGSQARQPPQEPVLVGSRVSSSTVKLSQTLWQYLSLIEGTAGASHTARREVLSNLGAEWLRFRLAAIQAARRQSMPIRIGVQGNSHIQSGLKKPWKCGGPRRPEEATWSASPDQEFEAAVSPERRGSHRVDGMGVGYVDFVAVLGSPEAMSTPMTNVVPGARTAPVALTSFPPRIARLTRIQ